jgi:hypothetical protein
VFALVGQQGFAQGSNAILWRVKGSR